MKDWLQGIMKGLIESNKQRQISKATSSLLLEAVRGRLATDWIGRKIYFVYDRIYLVYDRIYLVLFIKNG